MKLSTASRDELIAEIVKLRGALERAVTKQSRKVVAPAFDSGEWRAPIMVAMADPVISAIADIAAARGEAFDAVLEGALMCALSQSKNQFGVEINFDKLCHELELAESEGGHG